MFNSNPIEINKSSLVSLKAEILRKQQEVKLSKLQEKLRTPIVTTKTKKKQAEKAKEAEKRTVDPEENEILTKSRQILENKANLYNSLAKRAANLTERDLEISRRCLVQFDRKEPVNQSDDESDGEYHSDEYEAPKNPDEEWVEYVDYLGRTRKCLRKDLEYMKRKDRELSTSLDPACKKETEERQKFVKKVETSNKDEESKNEVTTNELSEENELLSNDMRRELLRREWEKQEEELMTKKNIHYQDVLFSEARSHGVGYYAFSTDEEERAKQQENLKNLRKETSEQQKATAELKKLREQQLAARLKAARNRKRARMGLPPEEDAPETPSEQQNVEDEETKQKQAEKEALEKQKQEERSRFVRPWDIGKEILKKHHEYTQEEWIHKQRDQRNMEFAPPSLYSNSKSKRTVPDESDSEKYNLFFSSKKSKNEQPSRSDDYKDNQKRDNDNSDEFHQGKKTVYNTESLEECVMAGLRYLREQSEKRQRDED